MRLGIILASNYLCQNRFGAIAAASPQSTATKLELWLETYGDF
ncbi:hypothetical protein [Merismopedia glauca]